MKKTLIALTLATLPVAAMAEVVLYGQIKAGYEFAQTKVSGSSVVGDNGTGYWHNAITDYGSRIGFKGQEDLGNGLKAIWQVEQRVSLDGNESRGWNTRDSFIGLEGGFGKVRAGYMNNYIGSDMGTPDAWEYNNEALGLGKYTRTGERRRMIRYDSPDFAGFSFAVHYTPRYNVNNSRIYGGRDVYGLGLAYENSGFFAKYGYEMQKHARRTNAPNTPKYNGHVHALEAGYDANNIFAAVGFQHARNANAADSHNHFAQGLTSRTRSNEVVVTGGYHFGNLFPKLSYAHGWNVRSTVADNGTIRANHNAQLQNTSYDQVVAGVDYSLSKRTTANAQIGWLREGRGRVNDAALGYPTRGKATTTAFGAGLKHVF
ncbi:major outer membrane protein P.IB [Neisseria sp. HSC-16F19]|nr:porin [Neisseria sp. HSC-16F19]MCP2041810.1 major outer membrane protein P.IB [Neisseria sp. HSC-16F19]